MTAQPLIFAGGPIFDGTELQSGKAACFDQGVFTGLIDDNQIAPSARRVDLGGDILSPGFVDLQVNGGGGVMLNDAPSAAAISTIAAAHRGLGTTWLLPTLISDTAAQTAAAIKAAQMAIAQGVAGVGGLHLEGPHLSIARKGAHDAALIRQMSPQDLDMLLEAAAQLPVLKVTIAPENVSLDQVRALRKAGILVSLGHSDADFDTCRAYAEAGASCVTHLFNAMSQMGNRAPGLVGAALDIGGLSCGLIADAVHVHPAAMRAAWQAKKGPGEIFLVSDAMAVAGTDQTRFTLNGRDIHRADGRLRLNDGTLAGADLDLVTAVRVMTGQVGVELAKALAAATGIPAALCGKTDHHLRAPGLSLSHVIRIDPALTKATPLSPAN